MKGIITGTTSFGLMSPARQRRNLDRDDRRAEGHVGESTRKPELQVARAHPISCCAHLGKPAKPRNHGFMCRPDAPP